MEGLRKAIRRADRAYAEAEKNYSALAASCSQRRQDLAAMLTYGDDILEEHQEQIKQLLRPPRPSEHPVTPEHSSAVRCGSEGDPIDQPDTMMNIQPTNSPAPNNPAPTNSPAPTQQPPHLSVIPWAPSIVYNAHKGCWVQLVCPYCNGNQYANGRAFFGPVPFHEHVRYVHGHDAHDIDTTIKLCQYRVVPADEIKWIIQNKEQRMPYVEAITCMTHDPDIKKLDDLPSCTPLEYADDGSMFVPHAACVVRHPNGTWFELACPHCGGNSFPGKNGKSGPYLRGVIAFYHHLIDDHNDELDVNIESVIEHCKKRSLTKEQWLDVVEQEHLAPPLRKKAVRRSHFSYSEVAVPSATLTHRQDRDDGRLNMGEESPLSGRSRGAPALPFAESGRCKKHDERSPGEGGESTTTRSNSQAAKNHHERFALTGEAARLYDNLTPAMGSTRKTRKTPAYVDDGFDYASEDHDEDYEQ